MPKADLQRDKAVTREVHKLFWQATFHTPRYFIPTVLFYPPAFFIMHVYISLQIAYGIQAIILKHFNTAGSYAFKVVVLALIGQLIYTIATWAFNRNGIYGGTYVQRKTFDNYISKDYEFFGSNFVGALGAQASRIRDAFTDYNRFALFEIPRNVVVIFASLIVLATKSLSLAAITLACMAVVLSVTIFFSELRLKYRRLVSQASSLVAGVLGDSLSHGNVVKSFDNEKYEQERLAGPLKQWEKAQQGSWDFFIPQNFLRNMLMAITMGLLLLYSAHLYKTGGISIAVIALVQLYVVRLIASTQDVMDIVKSYEMIMSASYEAVATMLVPVSVEDPTEPKAVKGLKDYGLGFVNISFRYPESKQKAYAVKISR